ncbi:cystine transporter subunit [compost metagenome]
MADTPISFAKLTQVRYDFAVKRGLTLLILFAIACSYGISHGRNKNDRRLRFGFNPSNTPPLLYQFENESMPIATGGLIYEVSVAIAEDLGRDYEIVRTPRKLIPLKFEKNKVDVICHNSIRWNHAFNGTAEWSRPLFSYANVLVATKPILFETLDQVSDASVGTVENYVYADLESLFKGKTLRRDDSINVVANVKKLLDDSVDYVVMSEIEFSFYRKTYPQLYKSKFSIDKTDIQCSLSKKSSLTMARLNQTIDRLKKRDVFKKIYDRYADPKTAPEPFSYGLNSNDSPPFVFFEKRAAGLEVKGGLFFDIGLEIGKKLNRPVNFVLLPRGRLDSRLAEGAIEMVCYDNEAWAGVYADKYFWSQPIFRQIDYVVSIKDGKNNNVKTIADLKGKKLGTVLHFVYFTLTPYFQDGSIIREDAGSGAANIEKLNAGRVPFIILNNLEYNYYKDKDARLQKAPFEVSPVDVKCAVSKKSDLKIEKINAVISDLMKTGRMQKIFSAHH